MPRGLVAGRPIEAKARQVEGILRVSRGSYTRSTKTWQRVDVRQHLCACRLQGSQPQRGCHAPGVLRERLKQAVTHVGLLDPAQVGVLAAGAAGIERFLTCIVNEKIQDIPGLVDLMASGQVRRSW